MNKIAHMYMYLTKYVSCIPFFSSSLFSYLVFDVFDFLFSSPFPVLRERVSIFSFSISQLVLITKLHSSKKLPPVELIYRSYIMTYTASDCILSCLLFIIFPVIVLLFRVSILLRKKRRIGTQLYISLQHPSTSRRFRYQISMSFSPFVSAGRDGL